jgi:hypothetical protein
MGKNKINGKATDTVGRRTEKQITKRHAHGISIFQKLA